MARALMLAALLPTVSAFVSCPAYTDISTPKAQQLSPQRYQGLWYEVASANIFLAKGCQCTNYNFTLAGAATFSDVFSCRKGGPSADAMVLPLHGSFEADMPGKMAEGAVGPVTAPYWVLDLWGDYEYSLVYSCVPLLVAKVEYVYLFSRTPQIPAGVMQEMRAFAAARNISLAAVQDVPMEGCGAKGAAAAAIEIQV
uniref:Lipocalin/cytosolic fatty-acid binding domain-containing protein n=1 Tax=Alexandrium catenella TaxID=2925 RepID=A0A7S1RVR7_ALECA